MPYAEISLFGCNTSAGRNIAKSFANHFGVPTLGSQKKLNFDGGTPYTPWYRGGSSFTMRCRLEIHIIQYQRNASADE